MRDTSTGSSHPASAPWSGPWASRGGTAWNASEMQILSSLADLLSQKPRRWHPAPSLNKLCWGLRCTCIVLLCSCKVTLTFSTNQKSGQESQDRKSREEGEERRGRGRRAGKEESSVTGPRKGSKLGEKAKYFTDD